MVANYKTSYTIWESLTHNLTTLVLAKPLSSIDYYQDFRKYAVNLFTPTEAKLGWDLKDNNSNKQNFE